MSPSYRCFWRDVLLRHSTVLPVKGIRLPRLTYLTLNCESSPESPKLIASGDWELVFRPEIPNHPGSVRIVDPKTIDLSFAREWLRFCVDHHGPLCSQPSWAEHIEDWRPEWLIGVSEGKIVTSSHGTEPYITLSYTWGQTTQLRNTSAILSLLQEPKALESASFEYQIPRTIRHAMKLVEVLGFRFLWVDSLCIVQDDRASLDKHLEHMHAIFFNSYLTIVAADGQDAEYGLRGLSGIPADGRYPVSIIA